MPTLKARRFVGLALLFENGSRRFGKALIAMFLGIAMFVGLGAGLAPSAQAAPPTSSSLVLPTQVQEAEKPDIWIETNVVLDTQKKPTGYVELVLKARTPVIYFADNDLKQLRYVGDGLENDASSYWHGTPFDPENQYTYATSRQTTFREIAASLRYNTKVLVPVSWEHKIEKDESGNITNAYPDFYAKYYVDESKLVAVDGVTPLEGEEKAAAIRAQFADDKNLQRIAVPTLQYSTESVSSAVSYAGGKDGLISIAVNSNADTTLPEETPLAVVRFLYIGEDPIKDLLEKNNDAAYGYIVDEKKVSSWHDTRNHGADKTEGDLTDFFWFADDALIKNSTVQQALIYSSGRYQENVSVESDKINGINQFYATKIVYNGDEVAKLPSYLPSSTAKRNYTEETPEGMISAIHRPLTDEDNITVLATARKDGDKLYSYTSNLLFTTDANQPLVDGSNENIAFKLYAGPTYKSSGGGTVDDFAAVVFIDWDDTMLGALVVPKGDARDRVETYVEKFIHPTLRKSTALSIEDETERENMLFNLSRSLDRRYTYAGNHTSDYSTLADFAGKSYSEAETAMAADDAYLGKTIFPDGYVVDGVDMSGSTYPLTNKLDYAFLRRPVDWENTRTIKAEEHSPYVDSNGKAVDATEWILGAIDYDGTQTPENPDDNYWYTSGWAVVKKPSEVDKVWTTFSATGELSDAKLPALDSTTVAAGGHAYDGRSYFNADYIRATDKTDKSSTMAGCNAVGGATSATGGDMAFVTYADSAYFEFANFSDIQIDELFVKACYEPAEQLSWSAHYSIVSDPYYLRYGTAASTENGSVYSISFDYERIDVTGNGVRRARTIWTRVQYTMDEGAGTVNMPIGQDIIYSGAEFYVGVQKESKDKITAEFTPTSSFLSLNYGIVETYGFSNFVASGARSLTENEANVMSNFNYLTEGSLPESFENGYRYNNRFGSMGYIYKATLQQILEEACKEFENSDNWQAEAGDEFKAKYFTEATLMDLNIRIDSDGATVYGVKMNGDVMSDYNRDKALANTVKALYSALKIAYHYGGEAGVMSLDWHQLQYHVLNWNANASFGTPNGIDTGTGLRQKQDCGSFEWCRLDECAENVTVSVTNFEELFAAIGIMNDTTQLPAKRQAAEKAIQDNIVKIFNEKGIYKDNYYLSGSSKVEAKTKAELEANCKFANSDVEKLFAFSKAWYSAIPTDGWTTTDPDGAMGSEPILPIERKEFTQKLWMKYIERGPPGIQKSDFTFDYTAVAGSDKCTYWWFWWDNKPEPVDFSKLKSASATADDAVALLVHAAFELHNGNPLAWDDFIANFASSYNLAMRFRASERGDFFDSASELNTALIPSGSTSFAIEGDWRTTWALEALSDSDAFIAAVTDVISNAATKGSADGSWNNEAVATYNISPMGAQWEQIQYYLLHGELAEHPEYYRGTENGQYWWKGKGNDTRLIKTASPIDPASLAVARPTNATLTDLTNKLAEYAGALGASKTEIRERFLIWFNEETTVDLVFKRTNRGGNISGSMTEGIAGRMLDYIDSNNIAPATIRDYAWSQIQCYIIDSNIPSVKGAQRYTHDEWKWEALDNVWREAKKESITDLRTLILAIDDNNMGSLDGFVDLAVEGLDFVVTKFSDADGIENVLTAMKNAYEDGGKRDFTELANDSNLDSAWYLIQYYLQNGTFVTPTSDDKLLEETATAGKEVYYWKDGWGTRTGVTDMTSLRNVALSGIPARLEWLKTNGPSDSEWKSGGLSGAKGTSVTWPEIIEAIGRSNPSNAVAVWSMRLQFLIVHKDATREDADTFGTNEASKFYWWLDGQSKVNLTPAGGANPSAGAIMESIMRVMAAGDDLSGEITKAGELGKNVAALNIRKPANDTQTLRSELDMYSESELETALQSLVRTVYEKVAAANAPSGYASWDFITADGTFTYNKAAYDAVRNLNVYQVQHWLATNGTSYEISEDDGKNEYWWIENAEKPKEGGVNLKTFEEFLVQMYGYAAQGDIDAMNAVIEQEWDKYGFSKTAEDIIADNWIIVDYIGDIIGIDDMYGWAQLEFLILYEAPVPAGEAAEYAEDPDIGINVPPGFEELIYIDIDRFFFSGRSIMYESFISNIEDDDVPLDDLPEIGEDVNSPSDEEIPEKELQNEGKDEIIKQPTIPEEGETIPPEEEENAPPSEPENDEASPTEDEEAAPILSDEDEGLPPSETDLPDKPTERIDIPEYIMEVRQDEEAA